MAAIIWRQSRCTTWRPGPCDGLLTPDGSGVFLKLNFRGVALFDAATGRERRQVLKPMPHYYSQIVSPDGRLLATGERFTPRKERDPARVATVSLWEVATGQEAARMAGHRESVIALAFSPNGRTLATGSGGPHSFSDQSVRPWDVPSGRELRRFEGQLAPVRHVAFAADGRTLASASEDGLAMVWDASGLERPRPRSAGHDCSSGRIVRRALPRS